MPIDTLAYVKRLEAAGLERRLAEAHAEAWRDEIAEQVASKRDLDGAEDRLDKKIDATAERLDKKIDEAADRLDLLIDKSTVRLDEKIERLAVRVDGRFQLLQWMIATNIAVMLAVLWRLLK